MVGLQENYELFRDYSADKTLNIIHAVLEEAVKNKKMNPYPLDHTKFTIGLFESQKSASGAILNDAGDRILNFATYSSDKGISSGLE